MTEEEETETIASLKAKIEALQEFILDSAPSEVVIDNDSDELIIEMEKKIKLLTEQLEKQRKKNHDHELKSRMTLQQKLLEAKATSDIEIFQYKAQVAALQSKVHMLQEELNDAKTKSPSGINRTLLDDMDSDIDGYMSTAATASSSFRVMPNKQLSVGNLNDSLTSRDTPAITVDTSSLEKKIEELKYQNALLTEQKNLIESQLERYLSEISEIGSPPNSGRNSETNGIYLYPSKSIQNILSQDDLLYIGIVQRKQSSGLFGRWLDRLLIIDRQSVCFWIYPNELEKSLDELKESLQDLEADDRFDLLRMKDCTFRRAIPCCSLSHVKSVSNFGIDIHFKTSSILYIRASSSQQQLLIQQAFATVLSKVNSDPAEISL